MRVVRIRNQSYFRICPECEERIKIRASMVMWRTGSAVHEFLHPACYNKRVDAWRKTLAVTIDLHDHTFEWEAPGT